MGSYDGSARWESQREEGWDGVGVRVGSSGDRWRDDL